MKVVTLPAIFSSVRSRKDRSYSLSFDTRELGGEQGAALLDMHQSECWLLIAPSESELEKMDVPDYKPDTDIERKKPSVRLRNVMFIFWKQQGGEAVLGNFDGWYGARIEHLIDQWKAKLDQEDRA